MNRNNVNRLSHVLSIRLTEREFKHLKETLRNYQIKRSSFSGSMRVLLRQDLHRSRAWRKAWKTHDREYHKALNH
jgi:hypothetical protein